MYKTRPYALSIHFGVLCDALILRELFISRIRTCIRVSNFQFNNFHPLHYEIPIVGEAVKQFPLDLFH